MASVNKVILIGNLGRDPEMRYTANGTAVTEFSMAMNESWMSDGERKQRTEWANIIAWNNLAETCAQYLAKGASVYVEGRLQTRTWDGQDGQKHYRTEVVASTVRFLDRKGDGGGRERSYDAGAPTGADDIGDIDPDDLPFHHDPVSGVMESGMQRWR